MATLNSFPNNADEYIGAEEVMRWLHGRTSGVFGANGNAAVTAATGMNVSVAAGIGWLNDADGNGIVWWFDEATQLTIDPAEGTGLKNRIDRIVVQWRTVDYADKPELVVLKGDDSTGTATPKALTNSDILRQISLAQVSIPAGTTVIESALITDERTDPSVCGIVTESVAVDTTTINSQFQAFLTAIEEELADLQAGTAVELRKKLFTNTTVATTAWQTDSTYSDYGKRAAVALTGVLSGMIPEVVFSLADAVSGLFAPVAETYNGGVYIYANAVPSAAITIPTIICWRDNE